MKESPLLLPSPSMIDPRNDTKDILTTSSNININGDCVGEIEVDAGTVITTGTVAVSPSTSALVSTSVSDRYFNLFVEV